MFFSCFWFCRFIFYSFFCLFVSHRIFYKCMTLPWTLLRILYSFLREIERKRVGEKQRSLDTRLRRLCIIYALHTQEGKKQYGFAHECKEERERERVQKYYFRKLGKLLTETTGRGKAEIYGFCLDFLQTRPHFFPSSFFYLWFTVGMLTNEISST